MNPASLQPALFFLIISSAALTAADFDATVVPAFPAPVVGNPIGACLLDLSDELFGGVGDACVRGGLDRSRCCPVLAAWLFAAHARAALELQAAPSAETEDGPMVPDDNQRCVDSLLSALERRDIRLPQPNATCDTVLCFCGIRLHQIGSLRCPAAFNLDGGGAAVARNVTPTAAVRKLERDCRNASYEGCTRCLHSLEKVKGSGGGGDRAGRIFARDCQLMGLTWLLARNKKMYIPTVSAVLRAVLYSTHPPHASGGGSRFRCSPDQENMPLAVDSLQFLRLIDDSAAFSSRHAASPAAFIVFSSFALSFLARLPIL